MKLYESILNNMNESSKLAKFIKDSVDKLLNTDYTNCKFDLDENLAVFVGWSDGYDTEPTKYEIGSEKCPTCRINAVIAVRNDADWSDLDTLSVPFYEPSGEIYNCQYTVSPSEDYEYLADRLLEDYENIKELVETGELLLESKLNEAGKKQKFTLSGTVGRPENEEDYDGFCGVAEWTMDVEAYTYNEAKEIAALDIGNALDVDVEPTGRPGYMYAEVKYKDTVVYGRARSGYDEAEIAVRAAKRVMKTFKINENNG